MRIALWISKVINTHSEYIIIITFTRQQWLRERVWMSLLYVALHRLSCLVMEASLIITAAISWHSTVSVQHVRNIILFSLMLSFVLELRSYDEFPFQGASPKLLLFSRKATVLIPSFPNFHRTLASNHIHASFDSSENRATNLGRTSPQRTHVRLH